MLTQTIAIFVDAYRELNSKKLFWITLALSGLVVAIYAAIGIDRTSPTFLWFHLRFIPITSEIMPASLLYKIVFLELGLPYWLGWIATILALISTAPIFPDMIAGGAIETVLSKPISRWRLFLTKYCAGLLFVALQVAVFTSACFLVIGVRGGDWEPGLFLAVPIVVVFFSYLFAVCAVLGLLTRSTIASLLMTMLFWFVLYLLNIGDVFLVAFREQAQVQIDERTAAIARAEQGTARELIRRMEGEGGEVPEGYRPTTQELDEANMLLARMRVQNEEDRDVLRELQWWSGLVFWIKTPLPKTDETVSLMKRWIIDAAELQAARDASAQEEEPVTDEELAGGMDGPPSEEVQRQTGERIEEVYQGRSVWWVMGTSLAFEAVVLGFGAWRFARRDF